MKDAIDKAGVRNGGQETQKVDRGQTIIRSFGLDRSSSAGSHQDEAKDRIGGGPTNLAHSLATSLSSTDQKNGRKGGKLD